MAKKAEEITGPFIYMVCFIVYPFLFWIVNKLPVELGFGTPDGGTFVLGWIFAPIACCFMLLSVFAKLALTVYQILI